MRFGTLSSSVTTAIAFAAPNIAALGGGRFSASRPHVGHLVLPEVKAANERSTSIVSHNFSVPINHFRNDSTYDPDLDGTFNLRYWFDSTYYREGGPVFVILAGELDATIRLPRFGNGIARILAEATGGISVLLEHRYYGASVPFQDVSVRNLRFLTTEQALADVAYFAQHVQFPGLQAELTSRDAPYILYGGSYAGGMSALARKLYPDVFWGAISSSGVTAAIDSYWQYFDTLRTIIPQECSTAVQTLTKVVDAMLFDSDRSRGHAIKSLFNLETLLDDEFAEVLSAPLSYFALGHWDSEQDFASFSFYCAAITANDALFASTFQHRAAATRILSLAGVEDKTGIYTSRMLNYVGYINNFVRQECKGGDVRQCMSLRLREDKPEEQRSSERMWNYQTCTQWGFFMNGESLPRDRSAMVSRAFTRSYAATLCERHFNITTRPDTNSINKLGGVNFSYPRLALIHGRQDPWRSASAHAIGLPSRESSTAEPFFLIDFGVHHWDEYGPLDLPGHRSKLPPKQVTAAQQREVEFVKAWLAEWANEKKDVKIEQGAQAAIGEL